MRVTRRALLLFVVLLASCRSTAEPIVVGHKNFPEQELLGQVLAQRLNQEGQRAVLRNCDSAPRCRAEMHSGQVDVMVEYSGTAAMMAGLGSRAGVEELQKSAADGRSWLFALGYRSDYTLVVQRGEAEQLGLETIHDLRKARGGSVRLAVSPGFVGRSGDGLAALLRRHGLTLSRPLLVHESAEERLDALLRGHVDGAVLFTTDPVAQQGSVVSLRDDRQFFPAYEALVVARPALRDLQSVREALSALGGKVSQEAMARALRAMKEGGESPQGAAQRMLSDLGLSQRAESGEEGAALLASPAESTSRYAAAAARAADSAFSGTHFQIRSTSEPGSQLAAGRGRLAVMSALEIEASGVADRLRVVSVLGTRHLLYLDSGREGPSLVDEQLASGTGLPPWLESGDGPMEVTPKEDIVSALESQGGRAYLLADLSQLQPEELAAKGLQARTVKPSRAIASIWERVLLPPSWGESVETLALGVFLMSRSSANRHIGDGPLPPSYVAAPLAPREVDALLDVLSPLESPPAYLKPAGAFQDTEGQRGLPTNWLSTILNLFGVVFLACVAYLLVSPKLGPSRTNPS